MNPLRKLETFLIQSVVAGGLIGHYLPQLLQKVAPTVTLKHPYRDSIFTIIVISLFYLNYVHPRYVSPLRVIPLVPVRERGQLIFESPRGKSALGWIRQNPDTQLIQIRSRLGFITLLPSGPDALRDILNTRAYDFEKPWGVRSLLARSLGWGLILSEGDEHRRQKKALVPAFHIKRIRDLYPFMWEKTQILVRRMTEEIKKQETGKDGYGVIEVSEWTSKYTLDIIGPVAMGRDFQSLTSDKSEIADGFLELLRPSAARLAFMAAHFLFPEYIIRNLPLRHNRMLREIGGLMRSVCQDIINEKQKNLDASDAKFSDFDILSQIMQTKQFTQQELKDQMLTFLGAGHETTASALIWACYLLAKYPAIQEKLRTEVRAAIPTSTSPVTSTLLEGLPYLHGVCQETTRLYPTVPATVRQAVRDTTVASYTIPTGSMFVLVPYAINRHPMFWENADEAIPERWIDTAPDGTQRPNNSGGTTTNFSELTFLHGPRACIGQDFAKAELRCAVAGMARNFQMELTTHEEPRSTGVVTMKPDNGMRLKFTLLET